MKKNSGFICIEVIISICIFLLLISVAIPKIKIYNEGFYIDYFSWKLINDLRTVQQENICLPHDNFKIPSAMIKLYPDKYIFISSSKEEFINKLPQNIHLEFNRDNVITFNRADPHTYFTATIKIIGKNYTRQIHINSYGRIRM